MKPRNELVLDIAVQFRAAQVARGDSGLGSASAELDERAFDRAELFVQEAERRGLLTVAAPAGRHHKE